MQHCKDPLFLQGIFFASFCRQMETEQAIGMYLQKASGCNLRNPHNVL